MCATATSSISEQRLRLLDGRSLGYAEYGDPGGVPVFVFHGTPGSRLERPADDTFATQMGIRLVVPERPGYGLSDYQHNRTLLDWPADVAALATALHIERFALVGISGGGAFAAACAYAMPDRLTRVALVSSVAPITIPGAFDGMAPLSRLEMALDHHAPWPLLRLLYGLESRAVRYQPRRALAQVGRIVSRADRAILADPSLQTLLIESLAEAYRMGSRGYAWENRLFTRPWGFRPEEIDADVLVWQGEADVIVPPAMGRYLAAAIPGCRATFFPGEGHFLYLKRWRELLTAVIA